MFYLELKRELFSKYVLLSLVGILIISLGLNILILKDSNSSSTINEESTYSGQMTEDKLYLGLTKVRDEQSTEIKYQYIVSFISNLVNQYPGIMYTENKIEDYPDSYAKDFYNCWQEKFNAIIEKLPENQQHSAIKELNKINTPFTKYPGSYSGSLAINNLKIIYFIIIFLVTFLASTIYSDSIENKSMDIIKSTKFHKKTLLIRTIPVILYGILLTLIATLITISIVALSSGFEFLKSSFKVYMLFSLKNYTLGYTVFLMFLSEVLGILALTPMMGLISYISKKTNLTTSIGIGLNIFYFIMTFFINIPNKVVEFILNLFPASTSQIIDEFSKFNFDFSIWRPYLIMINMIIISIIFNILLQFKINKEYS